MNQGEEYFRKLIQLSAEEQLSASEERFRSLVEASPLGIMVFDTEGVITTINSSMLKILGSPCPGEAADITLPSGQPLLDPVISDRILKCIESGESEVYEHSCTLEENSVWLQFYISPLNNGHGRVTGALALVEEISDRKNMENELIEKDRRIQKELQLANAIQSSLFPINLPQVPGVTVAATAVSANEVGGDYCDLFVTKYNKLGIAIGDVMGKGVPAALFVALTYAFVRNYALELDEPSTLVNRVNRGLYAQLELTQQFITFFYGIYDPESRNIVYTNAGHNPPLVYRAATGECEGLPVRDFIMGGMLNAQYREGLFSLFPGDVALFYTDGLKEGRNRAKEQFGMDRIINCLKENHIHDPASIQEILSYEFAEFLDGEPPYDDVTMVVIKLEIGK
ncbi:MAG: SpoIIE family protein phosphatase [Thermincola sp.]|jgi:sigma-B regulation protein RsbU (phosphoserine phosphatase)|nr:SpoIIE family protein phosphatase [Thermincola sp.]MDT3703222.1 SpoIIE family protein phosphatase [Thermincola sp.]